MKVPKITGGDKAVRMSIHFVNLSVYRITNGRSSLVSSQSGQPPSIQRTAILQDTKRVNELIFPWQFRRVDGKRRHSDNLRISALTTFVKFNSRSDFYEKGGERRHAWFIVEQSIQPSFDLSK